jgi:hypothetical protein
VRNPVPLPLLCCLALVGTLGCGGDSPAPAQGKGAAKPAPKKPIPEVLDPSYDKVVAPEGKLYADQIYVENCVPVGSRTKVDIIDVGPARPVVIVKGAFLRTVRWEVSGFSLKEEYPASGFAMLLLARNQWEAVKGKQIVLRPSKE